MTINNIQKNETLKQIIDRYELRADKKLGQNFLLDPAILDRIVSAAHLKPDAQVLEVGPGPGGLTRAILSRPIRRCVVIEKDPRCVQLLKETIKDERLEIIEGDFLTTNWQALFDGKVQILANLPYYVATPIFIEFLKNNDKIHDLTLMFQKEVALRLEAPSNGDDFGRLSILTQWLCDVDRVFDLPGGAFFPPPKVTSSVVHLRPKKIEGFQELFSYMSQVTQEAFSQRRKMLRTSLKKIIVEEQLKELGIDPSKRAEALTVDQFITMAKWLQKTSSS